MGILTANLKHLYQRRVLWLIYVPAAIAVCFLADLDLQSPPLLSLGVIPIVGVLLGLSQVDVLSRSPFFLLPSHQSVVRWQALVQAVVIGLVAPLLWLPPGWESHLLDSAAMVCLLGMALCLLGSALVLVRPQIASWFVALFWVLLFFELGFPTVLERAVGKHPLSVSGIALVVIVVAWNLLGRRAVARRWIVLRASRKLKAQFSGNACLADLASRGVERTRPGSLGHYVCAALHDRVLARLSLIWLAAAMWCLFTVLQGYVPGSGVLVGVTYQLTIVFAGVIPHTDPGRLRPWGRNQRYRADLVALAVVTALATVAVGLFVLLIHALAPVMPTLRVSAFATRTVLAFHACPPYLALAPAVFLPLVWMARLWLRGPATPSRALARIGVLMVVLSPPLGVGIALQEEPNAFLWAVWWGLPVALLPLCWLALRYTYRHRDLV